MNIQHCLPNLSFITNNLYYYRNRNKRCIYSIIRRAIIVKRLLNKSYRKRRVLWAHKYLMQRNCPRAGSYNLMKELLGENIEKFKNFVRMGPEEFNELVCGISPMIERKYTIFRRAISVKERLAVTLRYLATGNLSELYIFMFDI